MDKNQMKQDNLSNTQGQDPSESENATQYQGASHHADTVQKKVSKAVKSKKSAAAFRTISEVANDLGVQQHVLRFWETKFSQVKPLKRGGGRRYYRPEDISLLQAIHRLLYIEGYTIKGVQKLLRDAGKKQIVENFSSRSIESEEGASASQSVSQPAIAPESQEKKPATGLSKNQRRALEDVLAELKELRGMIKNRS